MSWACAVAAMCALVACSSSNGAQPAPAAIPIANTTTQPAATGDYGVSAELRVAVHEASAGWGNPPAFWLCPIEGATFLCGTRQLLAVRGPDIVAAPAAGRAANDGLVEAVVGRWPDDAWLIVRAQISQCGTCNYIAYRWQVDRGGRGDRWVESARFASRLPVTGGGALGNPVAAWNGELYVIVDDGNGRAVEVVSAKPSAMATRIAKDSRCGKGTARIAAIAATTDALFVVGAVCSEGGGDVTRWTTAGPQVDHPVDATASLNITTHGRQATLFGGLFGEDELVIYHFDQRWIAEASLPRGTIAQSYARAPDGTEWIVVEDSVDRHPMVRVRGGDWQRPAHDFRAATAAYGTSPRLGRLWIAEGSVWLELFVEGDCLGTQGCQYRTLLLRSGSKGPSKSLGRDRGTS